MFSLITDPNHTMLRAPCAYCDTKPTNEIITGMAQVMALKKGVGLAANQVGIDSAFFIANFSYGFQVAINPVATKHGKEIVEKLEGCLSILGSDGKPKYSPKRRWAIIEVTYFTMDRIIQRTLKRQDARIFQHEMDHLEGRLCHDRVRV